MNTETMLGRENFYAVLFETIENYFRTVHNLDIKVSDKKEENCTKLYVYFLPLFCSSFPMSPGAKEFLYSEYNIRGNLLKYIVGKIGVFVIVHSYGIGAKKRFYINSTKEIVKNIFIAPCNRTIRFYNFKENYVDCMAKAGYNHDFLDNQLFVRRQFLYEFIPKVLKKGDDWYREEIMHGNALARVRNEALYKQSSDTVIEYMRESVADTMQSVSALQYYLQLKNELQNILCQLDGDIEDDVREMYMSYVDKQMKLFKKADLAIQLCMSHGDLQEGNVWINIDGSVTIYDWETAKLRSIWYDPITFFFRMHSGIDHSNLRAIMSSDNRYRVFDPKKGNYSDDELDLIYNIVILEDILFNLNEALQLNHDFIGKRIREISDHFEILMKSEV